MDRVGLHDLHADYLHLILLGDPVGLLAVSEAALMSSLDVDHCDQPGAHPGSNLELYLVLLDGLAFIRCLF